MGGLFEFRGDVDSSCQAIREETQIHPLFDAQSCKQKRGHGPQIIEVSLDNFQLDEKYLHQKIDVKTESGEIYTTSYIGFNGVTILNFQEENVFSQVMVCNE